jgi:hypothetical protein
MTPDEIKAVVKEALAEQRKAEPQDDVVLQTVATILKSFGIDEDERLEIKADFSHLRRWRKATEQASSYTFKAVITVIATGVVGMLWMGFKAMLGK